MPEIVCEVEIVGVGQRYAVLDVAFSMIPADEIDRVGKVGAACGPVTGLALVSRPGAIERLGIAISAGGAGAGDESQKLGARRARIGIEAGFGVDGGHQDRNRNAVLAFGAV